jgi:hypothetical protein
MAVGKLLLLIGLLIALIRIALTWAPGLLGRFGHLPGDIRGNHPPVNAGTATHVYCRN